MAGGGGEERGEHRVLAHEAHRRGFEVRRARKAAGQVRGGRLREWRFSTRFCRVRERAPLFFAILTTAPSSNFFSSPVGCSAPGKMRSDDRVVPKIRREGAHRRVSVLSQRRGRRGRSAGDRRRDRRARRQAQGRRGPIPPLVRHPVVRVRWIEALSWARHGPVETPRSRHKR